MAGVGLVRGVGVGAPDSVPGSVRWLTAVLAVAGVAAGTAAGAVARPGVHTGLPPAAVAVLLAALTAAAFLQLRFSFRGHYEAVDLFDAVLAPVVFALPGMAAVVLAATAMGLSEAVHRTKPVKLCFNMAQWAAAAGAGSLVYARLARGDGATAGNLAAVGLAMAAVALVNHLAMVGVFSLVTGSPVRSLLGNLGELVRLGWLLGGAVNLAFGYLLVAALATGAWTTVLFFVPLGLLHWGNRGYAEARADRARLAGLQRATHALVGPIDPRDAIAEFLAEVRQCFAVEVVELVLPEADGHVVQRLGEAEAAGIRTWPLPVGRPSLAVDLLDAPSAVRIGSRYGEPALREQLRAEGWRDCLAAPLLLERGRRGVLCVYNRTGLEGFETGELAVLEALARELAGALEKADLVEEVLHQALHDSLTGLPNRTLFHQRVQRAVASEEGRVAVMLIDLNRFKEVNDTLGHHNGDLLLQDFSRRVRHCVRPTDTVARLGGDEFAIVIPRVAGNDGAERVAARVLRALEQPFFLHDLALDVDAAIGIALHPDHGTDAATLLQRADVAMYSAKATGRGYEVYDAGSDRYSPRRLALVGELRSAAAGGQMRLHYQPKLDVRSGRVTGVEALLRWEHPIHGMVPPDEFIPIAEQTGSIRALTTFVLEEALAQITDWRGQGLDLDVAVNLSVRSLLDTELPDEIGRHLEDAGVHPSRLILELTESSVMTDPARTGDVLDRLHALGVRLSIDDYGTGYSSLSYLRRLPVHEMKIDKSFVRTLGAERHDDVIVRSTVDLGHNLGLQVVAEGVEDEASWARLAALGCDSAQGYWLSRPVPADAVAAQVARLHDQLVSSPAAGRC
ncbi:MAG TPA: EAL domain-containing protein [Acidimicrobiales bacterium]|nr:EAL domain-containing protein [Acidimicrobiales bacterium]